MRAMRLPALLRRRFSTSSYRMAAAGVPLKGLSVAATSTPRSGIRAVMDAAWALEKEGVDVIHMEVGQPNFDSPAAAVSAAQAAAANPVFQRYIPNAGLDDARDAVARMYTEQGCPTGRDNIIVTQGCMFALTTALSVLLDSGDEVLCPNPGWPNYEMCISLLKAKPTWYTLDPSTGFFPDFDTLEAALSPKTKCMLVCNPSNPTGAVFDKPTLARLADFATANGIYLISDEIYGSINFSDSEHYERAPSILDVAHDSRSTVVLGGVSKSYSMTGFRVGWLRAAPELINVGNSVQEAFVSCGVPSSQMAAIAALESQRNVITDMVEAYQERRDIAVRVLMDHGLHSYTPSGAFYLMVDTHGGRGGTESSTDFASRLLAERHVAVAPGDTFGSNAHQFVRISLATDTERVREGMVRLCAFIKAG